jgi:hypothetical protein
MMLDELRLRLDDDELPSFETFRNTWATKFSELKIPKFNTLGACDTCTRIKSHQAGFTKNSQEWNNLRRELASHLLQVRDERLAQQTRDQSATAFPHVQWTVTTDFMQDLYLPWIVNRPKGWLNFFFSQLIFPQVKKEIHADESIWHNKSCPGNEVCNCFVTLKDVRTLVAYLPHWEHNSNIHISLLYKYLWKSIQNSQTIPTSIYLQLDNCAKDNKNQYVFLSLF